MAKRLALIAVLAVLIAAPAGDGRRAAPAAPPDPVALDDGWEYSADTTRWRPVSLPHTMDASPTERGYRGTVGWYRLRFAAPDTAADGYAWAARFEGARRTATVWLNGRRLATRRTPYVPFEVELRGLRPGRTNTLLVRTDNRRPRGLREGWWNYGGLVRRVSLVPRGAARLQHAAVLPRRACASGDCPWTALVDAEVVAGPRGAAAGAVELTLTAPDGTVTLGSAPVPALRPGQRAGVRHEVAIAGHPALWSPEHPALYDADVRLLTGGRIEDVDRSRVGLRTVSVRHGRMHLNGRPLSLRGASIQEDLPGRGSALRDADIARIAADVEELGADVTRAHHLLDERLLDRFDERGILVWSQAPVYHRDVDLRRPGRRAAELRAVRDTIRQARRHPSVLVHSVANELSPEADRLPGTSAFLRDAARLARAEDPTRPVALDLLAYPGYARQESHDRFDVLGVNHYYGWYAGKPHHSTRRFGDLVPHLRELRRRHPRQALVITEFGAEATRGGPATEKGTYAFQTSYLHRTLDVADAEDYLSGAIYWTAREFAVKPRWRGGELPAGDAIHSKALRTYDGRRKPAWYAARRRFAQVPTFR